MPIVYGIQSHFGNKNFSKKVYAPDNYRKTTPVSLF
jgi:hypothetical protein